MENKNEIIVLLPKDAVVANLFAAKTEALEEELQSQICEGEKALLCAEGRVREALELKEFSAPVTYIPMKNTLEYFEDKGYVFEKTSDGKWVLQPKDLEEHLQAWKELIESYYG